MNKREIMGRWLQCTGLTRAKACWAQRCNRTVVRILAYHRILNATQDFPYDPDVISATPNEFRRQMEFVRTYFSPLTFGQLAAFLESGRPLPANPLLITFDDGYRDNYTNAWPILHELGLPATIFIVTDHIGTNKIFWWDKIAWAIRKTSVADCRFGDSSVELNWALATAADRERFRQFVLAKVKAIPELEKRRLLAQLWERLQINGDPAGYDQHILTWDQVRELHQHGIEFGSHTCSHPILAHVSAAQLDDELCRSRSEILKQIGVAQLALAYPAGSPTRYNDAVIRATQQAGYKFAVTYFGGINQLQRLQPFELRRIPIEREDSFEQFSARLVFSSWR